MSSINYLAFMLIIAGFNAGLLDISAKYGLPAKYDYHRPPWLPKFCEFCICFWASVIVALLAIAYMPGFFYWVYLLLTCFPTAAYSKMIYSINAGRKW